jgi:hypothetical protein
MIRVPLGDLRVALSNPAKYAQSFKPGGGVGGPSKYGMFLHAIGFFHKTNDLAKAQNYLDATLTKNFKNTADLPDYARKLDAYVREWRRQGNALVRYRDNIAIPIAKQYATFTISGQAARVDLIASGGYGIWMFGRDVSAWEDDPRMPLLQYSYAERLGVEMGSITVGIYDFETGVYSTRSYSVKEVKAARQSVNELLETLRVRFSNKP